MTRLRRTLMTCAVLVSSLVGLGGSAPPAAAEIPVQQVRAFGAALDHGSPPSAFPLVGIARAANDGYWLAAADGGVFAMGGAPFHGSAGALQLAQPIVGMASLPDGSGYWLAAADGGVFTYGAASFFGSTGSIELNDSIVGIAGTPTGRGYWLAAADGGVFAFGDAGFFGSTGHLTLNAPITGMAATPDGDGYWLVAEDGGVFAFGSASFHGSAGHLQLNRPISAMAVTPSGSGYWLVAEDGGVFTYGDATWFGTAFAPPGRSVAGIVATASGDGYWTFDTLAGVAAPPLPEGSGAGRRIVYSNSRQRVWLVEAGEVVVHSHLVSGRRGMPRAGTYQVFSKSRYSASANRSVYMQYMVRFAWGTDLAIGFHSIPYYPGGKTIQSEAELGEFRSAGCVRQRLSDAARLWDFAPVGTKVVVTP